MANILKWLKEQNETVNKGNIFPPPLESQMAIDFLRTYLLGEDWYTVNPISQERVNTEIVFEILFKYSKRFKKEYKTMKKKSKVIELLRKTLNELEDKND